MKERRFHIGVVLTALVLAAACAASRPNRRPPARFRSSSRTTTASRRPDRGRGRGSPSARNGDRRRAGPRPLGLEPQRDVGPAHRRP